MNILHLLDSLLADWTSARVRRSVHTLLLIVALVVTAWLAAEGDWLVAIGTIVAAVYAGANRANTYALTDEDEDEDEDEDDLDVYDSDLESDIGGYLGEGDEGTFDVSGNLIASEDNVSDHGRPA